MSDHTDPIRLVLSLEQMRDPILLAMGRQISMKDRELALANDEIRQQAKRISEMEKLLSGGAIVCHAKPTAPQPQGQIDPLDDGPENVVLRRKGVEPWVVTMLREHGPMTAEMLAKRKGCSLNAVRSSVSNYRDQFDNDGKRPKTYRLKASGETCPRT